MFCRPPKNEPTVFAKKIQRRIAAAPHRILNHFRCKFRCQWPVTVVRFAQNHDAYLKWGNYPIVGTYLQRPSARRHKASGSRRSRSAESLLRIFLDRRLRGEMVARSVLPSLPISVVESMWRSGRVVECDGLENRWTRKGLGGSNPSSSARSHFANKNAAICAVLLV
jgi:hypothetical protein